MAYPIQMSSGGKTTVTRSQNGLVSTFQVSARTINALTKSIQDLIAEKQSKVFYNSYELNYLSHTVSGWDSFHEKYYAIVVFSINYLE